MGKMNVSIAVTTPCANEQRTMNNEHYSKQTQSNPISPPRRDEIRDTRYEMRSQTTSTPLEKTNPVKPNFSPPRFFRIFPFAPGYTTLSLPVRISRNRAAAEDKSDGVGFWMTGSDLQYETNVQDGDKSSNSL